MRDVLTVLVSCHICELVDDFFQSVIFKRQHQKNDLTVHINMLKRMAQYIQLILPDLPLEESETPGIVSKGLLAVPEILYQMHRKRARTTYGVKVQKLKTILIPIGLRGVWAGR